MEKISIVTSNIFQTPKNFPNIKLNVILQQEFKVIFHAGSVQGFLLPELKHAFMTLTYGQLHIHVH